jgi:hypothetical protein
MPVSLRLSQEVNMQQAAAKQPAWFRPERTHNTQYVRCLLQALSSEAMLLLKEPTTAIWAPFTIRERTYMVMILHEDRPGKPVAQTTSPRKKVMK